MNARNDPFSESSKFSRPMETTIDKLIVETEFNLKILHDSTYFVNSFFGRLLGEK